MAGIALAAAWLAAASSARAVPTVGRVGIWIGGATMVPEPPAGVSVAGFHMGLDCAWHLGHIGPMVSLDVSRFGTRDKPLWSAAVGAGLRGFMLVPHLKPLAVFASGQGVLYGSDQPLVALDTVPLGESFVGWAGEFGLEWTGAVQLAAAGRYTYLIEGPQIVTISFVLGFGAP
jgi:hypothetical protein